VSVWARGEVRGGQQRRDDDVHWRARGHGRSRSGVPRRRGRVLCWPGQGSPWPMVCMSMTRGVRGVSRTS
jgi:hypothetical protein